MKTSLTMVLIALTLVGCNTGPGRAGKSIADVQVGILDVTPRPATVAVTPFLPANAPKNFTDIAHLTVQGYVSNEATLISFLAAKARSLGANGIIYGPAEQPFHGYPASATDQTLRVYRAEAIVYQP